MDGGFLEMTSEFVWWRQIGGRAETDMAALCVFLYCENFAADDLEVVADLILVVASSVVSKLINLSTLLFKSGRS